MSGGCFKVIGLTDCQLLGGMSPLSPVFDAHLRIIDLRFPLQPNAGFLPAPFRVADYLARVASLGITGGAVISGSFQGWDQKYLIAALAALGPEFVGVTQLPDRVSDREILRLSALGVRAVRFNLRRGGSGLSQGLEAFAERVHDLAGWHVELYADAEDLETLRPRLLRLPAVSIDHLGLSVRGLPNLLRLAEGGVRVKATGFGRVDFPAADALAAIHRVNPHALMFGTDLPSTRAPRPFRDEDLWLVRAVLGEKAAHAVFWDNAVSFYGFPASSGSRC